MLVEPFVTSLRAGSLQVQWALIHFTNWAAWKRSKGRGKQHASGKHCLRTFHVRDTWNAPYECVQQNKAKLEPRRRCLWVGRLQEKRSGVEVQDLIACRVQRRPLTSFTASKFPLGARWLAAYFTRRLEGGTLDSTCPDPRNLTSHLTRWLSRDLQNASGC